jgi:alkanesulfonate monooxygenase SsuD/methylene tetrahydromethanopterin reductase-like flavin-dependent oxidoreductase (luciferase family)
VPTRPIPIVIGGAGPRTLALVREHAGWWNVPVHSLDRLDEGRAEVGDARVSLQTMVALVPSEAERGKVTELFARRFGAWTLGDAAAVGTVPELVDHFAKLRARGVERCYVWFADFAPPETLARFGEVMEAVAWS